MENLFYDCDIDSKFDLKGSLRNRLVDPNNQNGGETVLLDENLIQSMSIYIIRPFFIKNDFDRSFLYFLIRSVLLKSIIYTES